MPQATTTFLQLCRQVARDSGVISGVKPSTTVGQTDQLLQLVEWVKDAWVTIQSDQLWPWMRTEFSEVTIANTASYTAAGWGLTDHSDWVTDLESVTMYLTATGVSDEGFLQAIPYATYRKRYLMGTQTAGRPVEYAISPTGVFYVGPKPDAVYTIRGEYFKTPQVFSADADAPTGLPEEFVKVITYRALLQFGEYDEAGPAMAAAEKNYRDIMGRMYRKMLPALAMGGRPLA